MRHHVEVRRPLTVSAGSALRRGTNATFSAVFSRRQFHGKLPASRPAAPHNIIVRNLFLLFIY